MTYLVTLPWPPKELSPNARVHWRKKAPITKAYKHACWALCKEAALKLPGDEAYYLADKIAFGNELPRYHIWIDFYPPDKRARDDDNLVASFKAGRDGVALALGIDDKRFICHPMVWREVRGYVQIRITAGPMG